MNRRLSRKTSDLADPSNEARQSTTFWFVAKEKLLKGPFTFEQILAELAEGHFDPGDYCWRQGFQEWRPLCSVGDFGFQVKPYVVRAYPEVPVPSARAPSDAAGAKSSLTAQNNRAQVTSHVPAGSNAKTVKVRLERQRRFQVGLWERTAMVVFSVLFAWGASWVALTEVEEGFAALYERHAAGEVLTLGEGYPLVPSSQMEFIEASVEDTTVRAPASVEALEVEIAAHAAYWTFDQIAPVLSAPGFEAFESEQWAVRGMVQRPITSPLETIKGPADQWRLPSGHKIEINSVESGEVSFKYKADPIYVQPYEVLGRWSAARPTTFQLRSVGHPGL